MGMVIVVGWRGGGRKHKLCTCLADICRFSQFRLQSSFLRRCMAYKTKEVFGCAQSTWDNSHLYHLPLDTKEESTLSKIQGISARKLNSGSLAWRSFRPWHATCAGVDIVDRAGAEPESLNLTTNNTMWGRVKEKWPACGGSESKHLCSTVNVTETFSRLHGLKGERCVGGLSDMVTWLMREKKKNEFRVGHDIQSTVFEDTACLGSFLSWGTDHYLQYSIWKPWGHQTLPGCGR